MSVTVTAFAAEIQEDNTNPVVDTAVSYEVAPTYTVTIPNSVTLGETGEIKAEDVVVPKFSKVLVKLTGTSGDNDAFTVKTNEGAVIEYTVTKNGANVAVGDTVLEADPAADDADTGSTTLKFNAPKSVKFTGTYTGTVTFTVSVESEL